LPEHKRQSVKANRLQSVNEPRATRGAMPVVNFKKGVAEGG
jgi:hypothetical protein